MRRTVCPALTCVPVYAMRSMPDMCAHTTHTLPLCSLPALTQSPEQSSPPSAQFPRLMGASQKPACLPPRSLPPGRGVRAKPGGLGSRRAGFCPGCVLIITVISVPCLAPCPSGNLHPMTSIAPCPFWGGGGRDGCGPREAGGRLLPSLQGPAHVPLFQAEGGVLWWGGAPCATGRGLGRCFLPWPGRGNSFELCCPSSGGQAAPAVSIWGPPPAPLSLASWRVGPRHSCGWEPRLEANGAAAAADATADAARPLHTHPPLPPPPACERVGGGRGQPPGGQAGGPQARAGTVISGG